MKVKFGSFITEGRGKINGHVASRNRAGAYLRTKVTPVNPRTSYQLAVRSILTTLSQAWRALAITDIRSWNNAVELFKKTDVFGDLKRPSGFNLFQRLNNNLASVGIAQIDTAPSPESVATVSPLNLAVDSVAPSMVLTLSAAVPTGSSMRIWATAGQSAGKNFVKSEYRLITYKAAATATPVDITTAYRAKFGEIIAGQKYFVKVDFVNITTGQASVAEEQSDIAS